MKKNVCLIIVVVGSFLPHILVAQQRTLTMEEKIYSFSLIWKELSYTFAFPENLKEANLDSLYTDYLPRVMNTETRYDYFRVLNSFMAHFNEAHTRIYTGSRPDDMPALRVMNVGPHIIVSEISEWLSAEIPVGSEVLKVQGKPVMEFLTDSVYPYIAAATPHWKFEKSVTEMLYGRPLSAVVVTARTPEGKIKEIELLRDFIAKGAKEEMVALNPPAAPINIQILEDHIGYIQLSSCLWPHKDKIEEVFREFLPELRSCRGLIIDLRGNRGGTDEAWHTMAFHLMPDREFDDPGKWLSRKYIPSYKMWGEYDPQLRDYLEGMAMEQIRHGGYKNPVPDSLKLLQPLVIISGKYVASAAEDFLLILKESGRATVVGGPSVGCIGEPMFIPLPGDFGVMMCAKKYVNPEGVQYNHTGILPDVYVEESYSAYLEGRDNILECAVEELRKQMN